MNIYQSKSKDLPRHIREQVLALIKVEWPEEFEGTNKTPLVAEQFDGTHFVILDGDTVIAHTAVAHKDLEHAGKIYKMYGLSDVIVDPKYRGKGYAVQLIKKAKEYIESTDADIILFHTRHENFYQKFGFERIDSAAVFKGSKEATVQDNEHIIMSFLSEKGKAGRHDFETKPIYFGTVIW